MYMANLRGIIKLIQMKPAFVRATGINLTHRLENRLGVNNVDGLSHPPELITVMTTDRCNLRCRACHYAYSESPGYHINQAGNMQPEIFRKLMDEIPGKPLISFTGGEPLLNPFVFDFIAYTKENGRFCNLVTNGWLLEKHAYALCEAGLDMLVVSVDGPKRVHNAIRGKDSFERLVAGLMSILAHPKRPLVFLSMAISDKNFGSLVPMYEFAKHLGVDGVNINHLWMQTSSVVDMNNSLFPAYPAEEVDWEVQTEKIDSEQVADGLETIRRRSRGGRFVVVESPYLNREEILLWYREPEAPVKYKTTRCGWIRFKVWSDGKVKPCRDWVFGDLNERHAMEIWNGPEYRKFRRTLKANGMLPMCARCCVIAHR